MYKIQSFIIDRFKLIFLGFFIGFLIDIDNEISLIGVNSFLMPISCYFLGFVRLNSSNWETHTKIIYIVFEMLKSVKHPIIVSLLGLQNQNHRSPILLVCDNFPVVLARVVLARVVLARVVLALSHLVP